MTNNKSVRISKIFAYLILICAALCCLIPFFVVISASFSDETEILKYGYSVFPRKATVEAYKMIFQNPDTLINAYITTILTTVIGTVCALTLTMFTAYPLSRKDFVWRNKINIYFYFTMLFSGGMIPSYILITQYLKLANTFAVLIIPLMLNVWNMFLLRTYFSSIDNSIIEAAKIDGANEYQIFFKIIFPMTQVGLATVAYMILMAYWNDWYICFMYMSDGKYTTLQYYLHQTLSYIDSMLKIAQTGGLGGDIDVSSLPSESARMAMCILAVGPMLFVFMFFQKYFTSGIALGSVKG